MSVRTLPGMLSVLLVRGSVPEKSLGFSSPLSLGGREETLLPKRGSVTFLREERRRKPPVDAEKNKVLIGWTSREVKLEAWCPRHETETLVGELLKVNLLLSSHEREVSTLFFSPLPPFEETKGFLHSSPPLFLFSLPGKRETSSLRLVMTLT